MCKIFEDLRNEARAEGVLSTVKRMIDANVLPLEKIAEIAGIPYDEVKA